MTRYIITIEAPDEDEQLARSVGQQIAHAGWPPGTVVNVDEDMPIAGGGTRLLCLSSWIVGH
jgi:hypothetical protein